jgi:hypothetical protein
LGLPSSSVKCLLRVLLCAAANPTIAALLQSKRLAARSLSVGRSVIEEPFRVLYYRQRLAR